MPITIAVNGEIFSIANDTDFLVKDKQDILCCVDSNDSTVVQIWETSPIESQRNLILASRYSNFSSPTGSTGTLVVSAIIDKLNTQY